LQWVTWETLPLYEITTLMVDVNMVFAHPEGFLKEMNLRKVHFADLRYAAQVADYMALCMGQPAPNRKGAQVCSVLLLCVLC
jgi:hypothetical protein